jgi:uncharacterized membrane protein
MPNRKLGGWVFAAAVVIVLGGFWVRVHDLAHLPPGFVFDAEGLADALRLARGIPFPLYFDTRPEPLYRFVLAGWFHLAGTSFFAALFMSALISTLGIALAYQAGRVLLRGTSGAQVGALIAAAALAASMPNVFLARSTYRLVLLTPVLFLAVIMLLRAARSRRWQRWALAGGITTFAVHTYLAGIAAIGWLAGFLLHQALVQKPRPRWKNILSAGLGAFIVLLPWLGLIAFVPDLFARVLRASDKVTTASPIERMITGLPLALGEIFIGNEPHVLFNAPYTAALTPPLILLAVIGIGAALYHWRRIEGALLVGGLIVFLFPAILSNEPNTPSRLTGTVAFMCLFAAWGGSMVFGFHLTPVAKSATPPLHLGQHLATADRGLGGEVLKMLALVILVFGSLLITQRNYRAVFMDADRYSDPNGLHSIPTNYTLAYLEALEYLTHVTQPTYVPVRMLDTELGAFVTQRGAYPHVTTWARYGLTELPAGQIFYPEYGYFHLAQSPTEALQALLLPDENTIVLLPPNPDASATIQRPEGKNAIPLYSASYGWIYGRTAPRPASPLPDAIPALTSQVIYGDGLELVGSSTQNQLEANTMFDVVVAWQVTAPQPADIVTGLQLLSVPDYGVIYNDSQRVLPFLYPSARWQPGDIIPDLHVARMPEEIASGWYRWGAYAYVLPYADSQLPVQQPPAVNALAKMWLWGALSPDALPYAAAAPADMLPINAHFENSVMLLGYDLQQTASEWHITLYWQSEQLPDVDYTLFVHALDEAGNLVAQQDGLPNGGATPVWAWQPGYIIATQHTLPALDNIHALRAGMYHSVTQASVPATIEGEAQTDSAVLIWQK